MEPTQVNSIVMLLMLASCLMLFVNEEKRLRVLEVGMFFITLCVQAYYTSIAENMVVEILFTILWGWLTYRIYRRNYIKDAEN